MPIFRNTIRKSRRERVRRVDRAFEVTLKIFLICYFLFVLSAWLSYRPAFRISEVRIEGVHAVDAGAVRSVIDSELARHILWKIDRNNAVLYPRWGIHSRVMALDTHIKSVAIEVDGVRLTAYVSEYAPALLWCSPDIATATANGTTGCSFSDETGHIFAPAPEYSGSPFLIFVTTVSGEKGDAVLPKEEFDKVNIFLKKLMQLELTPHTIRQSGPHDFTIATDEPWVVRWSSVRDPEEDAKNLALVLQNLSGDHMSTSTLKSVDLRFGNKVFYR